MPTEELQKELDALHARNRRVEADKAWELSRTRRVFIATVTYCTAGVWLLTFSPHGINPHGRLDA